MNYTEKVTQKKRTRKEKQTPKMASGYNSISRDVLSNLT